MRLRAIFFGSWFAWLLFTMYPNVQAATLVVPSNDFPSIGAAVEHASDGDVIVVGAGVYAEHLQISDPETGPSRAITLRTAERAAIKGSIVVTNTTVEISGFTIKALKSTKPEIQSKPGVLLSRSDGSVIRNCLIRGFREYGIFVDQCVNVAIERNLIMKCDTGIGSNGAENLRVNFNTISGNNVGLENAATTSTKSMVSDTDSAVVDATSNWWGDSSGPYHETVNPTGTGDIVGGDVDIEPWDSAFEPPVITITRAYVSDTSFENRVYKGDTVSFTVEYSLTGGSEYGKYLVMSKVKSEFGLKCEERQKTVVRWDIAGRGDHVVTLTKRVPRCADDKTHITAYGADYWMEGAWVDVTYRMTLKDAFGEQLSTDRLWEAAIFLVKKRY